MRQRGILPPRMVELARREAEDRTLVCYGSKGWYMITNEDDVTRQSVVLTTNEVRWLRDLWTGGDEDFSEGGDVSRETAMERVDALAGFMAAVRGLSPRMEAIGRLAETALDLDGWGRSMQLQIHNVDRERFDSFDEEEAHYPRTETREFWSKSIVLNDGSYSAEAGPEGSIVLTLYTTEPPLVDVVGGA